NFGFARGFEQAAGGVNHGIDVTAHALIASVGPPECEVDDNQRGATSEAHTSGPIAGLISGFERVQMGSERRTQLVRQAQVVGAEWRPGRLIRFWHSL